MTSEPLVSFLRRTILAVAPQADRTGLAVVAATPSSVRTLESAEIAAFDPAAPDRSAASVASFASKHTPDDVLLVIPASWCVTREIALTPADWTGARAGVLEALEDLLPIASDDAHVGLLGLYDEHESCTRGVVIAARRDLIDPVAEALRHVAPAASLTVISSHMAALGLPVQGEAAASVVESDGAVEVSLELAHGLPVETDAPAPRSSNIHRLSTDGAAARLAVAAARASRVAPRAFVPLVGNRSAIWPRYTASVAYLAVAAALLALAPVLWNARLEAGADRAASDRAAIQDAFHSAQETRAEFERTAALCAAFDEASGEWASVLPPLRDAVAALGDNGFLYRLQLEAGVLTITGESANPGTVLERLEASPSLAGARSTAPLTNSPTDPTLRVFTVRSEVSR